jgi:hypothetical protein
MDYIFFEAAGELTQGTWTEPFARIGGGMPGGEPGAVARGPTYLISERKVRQLEQTMTQELKGRSELAKLADDLPVRARVCLTLLAGDVALQHLEGSPEFDLAAVP